jgi:hypothetical protein
MPRCPAAPAPLPDILLRHISQRSMPNGGNYGRFTTLSFPTTKSRTPPPRCATSPALMLMKFNLRLKQQVHSTQRSGIRSARSNTFLRWLVNFLNKLTINHCEYQVGCVFRHGGFLSEYLFGMTRFRRPINHVSQCWCNRTTNLCFMTFM